jgi:hypothetical protein
MAHPLVVQLRFTRSEFVRGLAGVSGSDARQRLQPMNCISWMVGHLAWQEQRYWLTAAQGVTLFPQLNELLAYGQPASTPPLQDMWSTWRSVTEAADPWLDSLTAEKMRALLRSSSATSIRWRRMTLSDVARTARRDREGTQPGAIGSP